MPDYWESLPHASLNGLEFPVEQRRVRGGRAAARRRFPFRAGQSTEDISREPRTYEYAIPLFAGMETFVAFPEPLYPNVYTKLIQLAEGDEEQSYATLLDPEHGSLTVKIVSYEWEERAVDRNGGRLHLVMEEEVVSPMTLFSVRADWSAVSYQRATDLDAQLAEAGIVPTLQAGFSSISAAVTSFMEYAYAADAAADSVAARLDSLRSTISGVKAAAAALPADLYQIEWSATRLLDSVTSASQQAMDDAVFCVQWQTPYPMSSYEIAVELYGDVSRYEEIEARNTTPNPLVYPARSTLTVAER